MGPATVAQERTLADVLECAELWCSDVDLLRAEFDAIVAAEWPVPPPIPVSRSHGCYRQDRSRAPVLQCVRRMTAPAPDCAERIRTVGRERSPP